MERTLDPESEKCYLWACCLIGTTQGQNLAGRRLPGLTFDLSWYLGIRVLVLVELPWERFAI